MAAAEACTPEGSTSMTGAIPTDTGLAIETLAAWQSRALTSGEDRLSGIDEDELRRAINEVSTLRIRYSSEPDDAEEARAIPMFYGSWARRRAFRELQHGDEARWRLPAAQWLLFEARRYLVSQHASTQRRAWTLKLFAAESMLSAGLESATGVTGGCEHVHREGCGMLPRRAVAVTDRGAVERALEWVIPTEETARRTRDIVAASLRASPRRGVQLRRDIAAAAQIIRPVFEPERERHWPEGDIGSAVMMLAQELAAGAWSGLGRARGGPLRMLEAKAEMALLCSSACRALLEAALYDEGELPEARYCGCALLAAPCV